MKKSQVPSKASSSKASSSSKSSSSSSKGFLTLTANEEEKQQYLEVVRTRSSQKSGNTLSSAMEIAQSPAEDANQRKSSRISAITNSQEKQKSIDYEEKVMLESLSFEDYVDDPEDDPLKEATPKGKFHYELC